MGKFLETVDKYEEKVKPPIQNSIYIVIAILALSFIIGCIFGIKSCSKEISYLNNFMNDEVKIHDDNYNVKILSAKTVDEIEVKNNKNENLCISGNFIKVDIELTQNESSLLKPHKLDCNDFKLKDHNGVHLPLNDIMGLVDINAIDMQIIFNSDGAINSDVKFSTRNAVQDFNWYNKEISIENPLNFTIYFKMDEGYKVEENIMILEIDFYGNIFSNKLKNGTDIVLAVRINKED